MNTTIFRFVLVVSVIALLLLTTAWSYRRWYSSWRQADTALVQLQESIYWGMQIDQLGSKVTAPLNTRNPIETRIDTLLHDAAEAAGLSADQLVKSASPDRSRLGIDNRFQIREMNVKLEGVTLRRLVGFLHHLIKDNPDLLLESLNLTLPKGSGTEATWNVDPVVLSYFVEVPLRVGDASG